MKPLYIEMNAFGSYQEEQIDFENIDHGLFLITGDTGAGKTTIFDAITYALYDETSGGKRKVEMMRSQYASPDIKTQVKFKFLYNGREYTIIRSPKQDKWKKVNNETGHTYEKLKTPMSSEVELILPDGTIYPGKKADIDEKIKEIIGLDVNQFTQIAMLAQGDFMKLLHAPSEERKEIFAKIFDTRIYAMIQKELWGRAKSVTGQMEENKKDITKELERVRCMENSAYLKEWEEIGKGGLFKNRVEDSPLELISNITQEAKNKQIEIREDKLNKERELSELNLKMRQADSINALFKELEKFEKESMELKEKAEYIKDIKQKVEKGSGALLVEKDYTDLKNKEKALADCKTRIYILKKWIDDNKNFLEEFKAKSEAAKAEYDEKSPKLHAVIEKLRDSSHRFKEFEELECSLEKLVKELRNLENSQEQLVTEKNALEEQIKELSEKTDELKENTRNIEVLEKDIEILKDRKDNLGAILEASEKFADVQKQLGEKEEILERAKISEYQAQQNYDKMYNEFINGQAEILRAELREGKPCPVCGSIHYDLQSMAHENSDISVSEKDLDISKNKLEKAKSVKDEMFRQLQEIISEKEGIIYILNSSCRKIFGNDFDGKDIVVAEYDKAEKELKELLETKAETENNNLIIEKNEQKIRTLRTSLEKDIEVITEVNDKINLSKLRQKELETKLNEIRAQLPYESKEEASQQLAAKQKALKNLKETAESCSDKYHRLLNDMKQKSGGLGKERENMEIREREFSAALAAYELSLKTHGFADTEAFREAFITQENIESYKNEIEQYNTHMAVIKDNVKRLRYETSDKIPVNVDGFEEKREELEIMKEDLEQQGEKLFKLVSVNEESLSNSKKLYAERKELNKKASIIYNVHNTANGQYSGKMIDFQTYIQRRYFKRIIQSANKRLYKMSNNQFILQCRELKDLGHRGYVGLDIDVYSIVNDQVRDVKTLSGGESFMAALAMALGMADMIQNSAGNIHIDTMFIDEGFGSLSDDTRNQAIEILNELSEGKRLVGIISHVSELKAQVETKLEVIKTDQGSKAQWK